MNILIINQHTYNRGDEAAGIAFMTALSRVSEEFQLAVLYNSPKPVDKDSSIGLSVHPNSRHYSYGRGFHKRCLCMLAMVLPFGMSLARLAPTLVKEYRLIRDSDVIINAPGGVNIGPYMDWIYLWRLYLSTMLKKNVAVYSISFGPLSRRQGVRAYAFSRVSKKVLRRVSFLSLRDQGSQSYARKLRLSYMASADTAFLCDGKRKELPSELAHLIAWKFVIVVPNELNAWHPNYRNTSPWALKDIYQRICTHVLASGYKVVMLPQLFGAQNDEAYMKSIAATIANENIEVVPDCYDSDTQQAIVRQASLLIGARYHSIVFSINNEVPFLSLAYEHKMSDMLSMLGLSDRNFDFSNPSQIDENALMQQIDQSLANPADIRGRINIAKANARELAKKTFTALIAT